MKDEVSVPEVQRSRKVAGVLVGLVVCGVAAWLGGRVGLGGVDPRMRDVVGGGSNVWVVQRPQAVEVSRLGGEGEQEGKARLGAYWVAEGPVEVEGEAARRLSALVLDPEAYVWDRDAERVFEAGVWVRFRTASQAVDVVVARDFEQVQVRAPGLEAGTAAQVVVLEVVSERWREELAGLAGLAALAE